ncbi:unnamed protein product [Gemmata massiliana]|uniref:Uncharacterized protein n=1 Tax=Gemmata massiliana TaxID=1210884 RepID=A0A6P2DAC3_9BACT|nr:hypothetical protein [Gemmata massiliana]VTR97883.1 unnamed protein product [Gemmata massiliana]
MRVPKLTTRLVKMQEACRALGCCRRTFWRRWHLVFTAPRPVLQRKGAERRVYEDELAIAIEQSSRGVAPVLNYRRIKGRL